MPIVGQRFGRLVTQRRLEDGSIPCRSKWECACDCGATAVVEASNLKYGSTKSCGCLRRAQLRKHGCVDTPEWRTWASMNSRCDNPRNRSWGRYGGRGVKISDRWRSFENFLSDMGRRPSRFHSIDRIDSDGNYEPGNCRWATAQEQSDNKRRTYKITARGKTQTITAWALETGMSRLTIWKRAKQGWDPEDILSVPPLKRPQKYRRAPG